MTREGGRLGFVRGQGAVALGLMVGNVLGYALALVAARRLGPVGFGELSALLAVIIVLAVLPTGLQTVVARAVAEGKSGRWTETSRSRVALLSLLVAGLALIPLLILGRILNSAPASVVLVALLVAPLVVLGWSQGLSQGAERLGRLAVLLTLNNGGRATGAILGVLVFPSAIGAIGGALAAATLAAAYALASGATASNKSVWVTRRDLSQVIRATTSLLALFLCANVDVVLARAVLEPNEAGLYAAGSIVTKVAFWLPQFVAVTALPRFVDPTRRQAALRGSLALVTILLLALIAGTVVSDALIVRVIGGPAYDSLAPLLPWFAVAGGIWALNQVFLYDAIARRESHAALGLWIGLGVLILLVAVGPVTDAESLIAVTCLCGLGVLLPYGWSARSGYRTRAGESM